MAKYSNTIEYSISTKLDSSGLTQLQTQIREVEASLKRLSGNDLNDKLNFNEPIRQLQELNKALSSSFNSSLGMLDLSKFKAQIQAAGVTAKDLGVAFKNSGTQGQVAMNNLLGQIGKIDTGLKRSSTTVDKMFNTISNTVRWGIVSSGFSAMLNSLHQSVDYVKELDNSLTQIMLVTDYSREQMNEYAKSANEAAKALGATTIDVTKGSQVFAQQGFDLQQSNQLAEMSIKLANASEQDSATTSDQITAIMNAYHISGDVDALNKALDSWAEVANISAADVEELAKASQKAASSASVMGVSLDQMNAQIATIESVTRDAPEQIGNGLKTLYSRMTDISEGKTDEEGFDLGKVTKELDSVGVSVMNEMGQIRSVGDIIEDLMVIWKDLDETSKQAAGQAIAGKYQLNRFYALMENSDMYQEYKEGSMNASGTLDQMNEEYINSMAGKIAKLQATLEGLFNSVFDPDNFYPAIDALTGFVDLIKKLVDSLGGGQTVLTGVVALFGRLFSNNMAQMINDANINRKIEQARKENALNVPDTLRQLGFTDPTTFQGQASKDTVDFIMKGQEALPNMSEQQAEQYNRILLDITNNSNIVTLETERMEKAIRAAGIVGAAAQDNSLGKNTQALAEMLNQFSQGENLKQYAQNFKDGKSAALEFKESLMTVIQTQKDFDSSVSNMDEQANKLKNIFNGASNALQDFKEAGVLQTEEFDKMSIQLENLENQMINFEKSGEQNEEELRELTLEVTKFIESIQNLASGRINVDSLLKTLMTGESNLAQGKAMKQRSESEAKAFNEGLDDQKQLKNILDVTAAIGQLTFAWQSFQSLESIWSNKDISDGEKILQTITNLSFALPSLINSIKLLREKSSEINWGNLFNDQGLGKLKDLESLKNIEIDKTFDEYSVLSGELELAKEDKRYAAKGMMSTAKKYGTDSRYFRQQRSKFLNASDDIQSLEQEIVNLGGSYDSFSMQQKNIEKNFESLTLKQKAFAGAANVANKATNVLGKAIQGLSSPIGIAGMAFVGLIANISKMKEQAEQTNISKLFEDYQKVSDNRNIDISQFEDLYNDYKETGKASDELINVSKTLGDQLDIIGDKALINAGNFDELSKKIHSAADSSDELAKKAADKTIDAIAGAESKHYIFANDFASYFTGLDRGAELSQRTGIKYSFTGNDESGMDPIEKYQSLTKAIAESEANLEEYRALIDKANDEGQDNWVKFYESQMAYEESIKNKMSEVLATEDMQKIKTIIDTESAALEESLPEKAKNLSDKSLQEVVNTLTDSEGEFKYLAEKIKEITGESGEEAGREYLLRLIQSLSGGKTDIADILSDFGKIDPTKVNEETKEKITNLKLSDEDFKVLGFDSAEAFWKAFGEALQDKTFTLDPKQFRYNDEKIKEIFKTAKMEDVSVDDYVKSFSESGGAGAVAEDEFYTLKERIEELDEAYKQAQDDLSKGLINEKELDNASKSLENAKDNLKQFAVEALETSNGLDELSEKWKDINAAIESGNPTELAGAYSDLRNILSQILNVDPSMITQDFMENKDVLAALGEVANGTTDSVWKLREAFGSEDLVLNAYLDTIGFEGDRDRLFELIDIAQAALPNLETGAYLDDTNFINGLTNLVMNSNLAAADIQKIFDGLGYDVQIDYETMEFPSVALNIGTGLATAAASLVNPAAGAGLAAGMQQAIDFIASSGPSIQVPKFTFVKKGNASGGSTYRKNTGGGGGGGGKGNCFVANTLVAMHGFYKKIQEVTKGDIVLSYNEITKTNEYSQVVQTMIHSTTEEIYTLSIKNEQLRVTGIHRFFIKRNNSINWIEASNLKVGDLVFLANGTWSKILDISVNIETRYVYNFEVSNNHNYYVGTNRILAHNKGGGGGGGGSGKTYEPKTKDPVEEEIDLYEKVNTQLDDVEETLKGIQQETDRLIGAKGRANMNKQIKLLQKEIDLQREKLKIQEKERDDLGRQLSSNFGITFDSEGFIDNYAETLKELEKKHNDLVNQYNATGTEEGQERLEKEIEKAKENIDKFKDLYKRYDELQGKEIKDTINQIEELDDSIEDLRIDAYKAAQEAIDDLKEIRDNGAELLGLFTDYKSDSPFRATIVDAEKLKNIFGGTKKEAEQYYNTLIRKNQELARTAQSTEDRLAAESAVAFFEEQKASARNNPLGTGALGLASQDLARLQGWVNNPGASDNPFGQNTAALYEAYEDAYNRMRELALESEEAWEQLEEDIIDGYEDIAEREEEQIDRYDRLTEKLETIADMRALVYGEEEFGNIARIYDQIGRSTLQQAKDQKMIYEQWVARYQAIEDKTSDIAKQVRTNMEEAEDKLIEIQKEVAEAWQKAFENALKEITAQTNKNLFGFRNLDDMESDWERDKEYSDKYYDNIQKAARIDQLRAKYLDLLDNAQGSSLDTQRRIRDAMNEQVKYLEDQKNLSEYNVKYANAQLEILQKQIALEDARNNKNQMRLRRDTQGNYRYVYSADQNDVRDKEQDLLQSQMDAYDMSKQNRLDTTQEAFNLYRTTMEQLEALNQRIRQNDEEAIKARDQLLADFRNQMAAYSEEIGDSWLGMVESIEWMAETGTDAVKDSVSGALEAIRTNNDEALTEMGIKGNETIVNAISDVDNLLNAVTDASNDMTTQAEIYRDLINDEVAPLVVNGYNDIDGAIQDAAQSTRDLAEATRELNEALMGDNAQLVEATQQLENYRKQLDDVKNSSAITAQQLRKAQEELDQSKAQNLNYKTILDDIAAGRRDKYGNVPMTEEKSGGTGNKSKGSLKRNRVEEVYNMINRGEVSVAPSRRGLIIQRGYSEREAKAGQALINLNYPTWAGGSGWDYGKALNYVLAHYDTGGYTGKWDNNDGKLAMLHQKELVLNASDTENILNAVNMVRDMTDMLKTFSGMSIKGTGFNKLGGDTIEQRVEITAEFPNVQSSSEIENALLNIADSAYQYSYRTR